MSLSPEDEKYFYKSLYKAVVIEKQTLEKEVEMNTEVLLKRLAALEVAVESLSQRLDSLDGRMR